MQQEHHQGLEDSHDFGCVDKLEAFNPVKTFEDYWHYEKYDESKHYTLEPFERSDNGRIYEHRLVRVRERNNNKDDEEKEDCYVIDEEIVSSKELAELEHFCKCEYCIGDWSFWNRPCAHCVGCLTEGSYSSWIVEKTRVYRANLVLQKYGSTGWLFGPVYLTLFFLMNIVSLGLIIQWSPWRLLIEPFAIFASILTVKLYHQLCRDSYYRYKVPDRALAYDIDSFKWLAMTAMAHHLVRGYLLLPVLTGIQCLYACLRTIR